VTPLEGTERAVSDLKVERKQTLSREDAARLVAALAEGMSSGGKVTVQLGSSTLELSMAAQVDCELEVAVDGDEIELELELKWSTSGRATAGSSEEESDDTDAGEDEADSAESAETEAPEDAALEDEASVDEAAHDEAAEDDTSEEDTSEEDTSEEDTSEDEAAEPESAPEQSDSPEDAGERVAAAGQGQDRRVPADRAPRPRRARADTAAGRSVSNGVDTAAVRAWAAANGLSVSPRGRIKEEVLQAYRDAHN